MEYTQLIIGGIIAILAFLFNNERNKRMKAEAENSISETKIADAKLEQATETVLERHKELLNDLAKVEEAEKALGKKDLSPEEVESYWSNRKPSN